MFSKGNLKLFGAAVLAATTLFACKKDDDHHHDDHDDDGKEYQFVRVLVSDQTASTLTQLEPHTGATTTFNTKHPLASLYPTASGRYAAVLYGAQNLAEVFDAGLTLHDDHVDVANPARWTAITAAGLKPTHFKSKGTESLIFNDGDGTLSLGEEANFNTVGAKFTIINAGLPAHHGAMAQFNNGTIAVTTAPEAGKSPNRVLVIKKDGSTAFASTLETGAIHGNASDGQNAVFGAFKDAAGTSGGVLVVSQSGEQTFIDNPAGFGAARLGSIYYAAAAKKFIGYAAAKGAYLVDVAGKSISAIYNGADAFQCKVDYAGKNLLLLSLDGKLRIYDLATGSLKKEGNVISAVQSTDTYKPVLEATARFAYIAMPSAGEVHQVDLADFTKITKHKVSASPVRMALLGFETSEGHHD
ncbi:hypothetical protein MKQ68_13955 [Chitinophaga horti]|uniref:DUF4374 domain-containing protein n=1 Tax=Chitinophaga horti TaxID=2920382 RepID=A0ABY6IV78_9BACT|nr:hypothetical protein [Chitinophaga horti]UYQ91195.1 hypothetical protein MKQ68_13955 [Chitinophaga horti]